MSPAEQSALKTAQRCASRCVELDTENQRLSAELAIWHAKPDRDKQWRSEALGIIRQRTTELEKAKGERDEAIQALGAAPVESRQHSDSSWKQQNQALRAELQKAKVNLSTARLELFTADKQNQALREGLAHFAKEDNWEHQREGDSRGPRYEGPLGALASAQALLGDAAGKEPTTAEPSNEWAVDLRKALVEILDTCGARGTYDAFRYHEAKLQAERILAQTGTAEAPKQTGPVGWPEVVHQLKRCLKNEDGELPIGEVAWGYFLADPEHFTPVDTDGFPFNPPTDFMTAWEYDPEEPTGTADDLIPSATVDAMREMVGDVPVEEMHAAIRKIAADPERVRQFNDLTPEQARELLSANPAHWKKERPIQVGDTVRHKVLNCLEWPSRTIRSIETDKPATWMEDWGPVAYFHEGGFWRLSQLERVDPIEEPKGPANGKKD